MVENETQAIQKNVEKDLFEEQSKILDRFYSLITLTFTAFGFSITALSFFFGRGIPNIQEALRAYHIGFSFLCLFLAFIISITNVLAIFHHRKLVKKDYMIGYREDNELINNNLALYLSIARHKNYYVIAITLIGLGITSFINHFSQHRIVSAILVAGFVVIVLLLIRNSRRYLS
ncbi:hypothetical protein RSJ42_11255 [Methanosarcina hadiensis]|uniref:hypothetical protein n=1 Tax=Methanosarcina hadiensis TaxID=3078083 RepID=UPI0039775210